MRDALDSSRLEPGRLVLEVTESVVMQDTTATLTRLRELRDLGVHIAIDDFGTGYSSLSYLHRFPIDMLKIDRSFVELLGKGTEDGAIAETIVALGRSLRLHTVAEGIETPAQRDALIARVVASGRAICLARRPPRVCWRCRRDSGEKPPDAATDQPDDHRVRRRFWWNGFSSRADLPPDSGEQAHLFGGPGCIGEAFGGPRARRRTYSLFVRH